MLGSTLDNHTSANNYFEEVDRYIQEELSFEAMIGPFDDPTFPLHISPLMTRDKAGSDKRRTIVDLIWPKGLSVNNGVSNCSYLGTQFELTYLTIDSIVSTLKRPGPATKIFKIDISRALRHVHIDPGDLDLLGFKFRDKFYRDLTLPFGFYLGSFFSKLSDSIRCIMAKYGQPYLSNYIDDLIYCGLPSKIDSAYQFLLNLLQELGLDINDTKLHSPDTKVVCLGILFDTVNRTISVPPERLQDILCICTEWLDKRCCTKNHLQSLLGSLLYITKCVRPARFLLNRILQVLRDHVDIFKSGIS